MLRPYDAAIVLCFLAGACVEPAPTEPDSTPSEITLSLLSGPGTPRFSTDEENTNPDDACATARNFPATLSVAVGDAGGVDAVNIRIFPPALIASSVEVGPASPESSHEVRRVGGTEILLITVRPPGTDLVRTGVLTTFEIAIPATINVDAFDVTGNEAHLYQVDVRDSSDAVICRND
jgi:hypothetical protein